MTWPVEVLIVEDYDPDARIVEIALENAEGDYLTHRVVRLSEVAGVFDRNALDITLLDLNLPDSTGLETFKAYQAQFSRVPCLVISSLRDEDLARKAVALGAQDFLVKGMHGPEILIRSIHYAIERHRLQEALRTKQEREIARLKGLLPSCMDCGKIRDQTTAHWYEPESYIELHSEVAFTHGLCPDCVRERVIEILQEDPKLDQAALATVIRTIMGEPEDAD